MNELRTQDLHLRILRSLVAENEPWRSRALLVLRGYVGAAVLLAHGLPKIVELITGDRHFVDLVAGLGFPAPTLFAWLSALTQVIGSAALIAGAAARVAAFAVATTITIGMLGVHHGDPFAVVEGGVAYVVSMFALVLLGPGELSLDRLARDRVLTKQAVPGSARDDAMVHVAITRRVRAGREHDFEEALRRFFREALDERTTSGAALILPVPGSSANEYGVLRSFPNEAAKQAFYRSDAYRHWELEVAPLVEGSASKRDLHGLEAFFRSSADPYPPEWKMAVLTWIAVNPAVWIWSQVVPRLIGPTAALLTLLVVNVFVVATLTWAFMPALVRVFRSWLR